MQTSTLDRQAGFVSKMVVLVTVGGGPACFSFMVPRFTSPTASNGETAEENKDSLCCWSHVGWMEATLLWFSIRAVVS